MRQKALQTENSHSTNLVDYYELVTANPAVRGTTFHPLLATKAQACGLDWTHGEAGWGDIDKEWTLK